MTQQPNYPASLDDGVWYCDAHGTYGCRNCEEISHLKELLREHGKCTHCRYWTQNVCPVCMGTQYHPEVAKALGIEVK